MKRIFFTGMFVAATFLTATLGYSSPEVKVVASSGVVLITPSSTGKEIVPVQGMQLNPGDRVQTKGKSYVDISFDADKKDVVRVGEKTDVIIRIDKKEQLELVDGSLIAVLKGPKGEAFKIKTPCAVCGARGTGWETKTDSEATEVAVFDDKVFVQGINPDGTPMEEESWVDEGYERKIEKFKEPGEQEKLSEDRMDQLTQDAGGMTGESSDGAEDGDSAEKGEQLSEKAEDSESKADERAESLQEDRSESKIEQMRDDEPEPRDEHNYKSVSTGETT